MHKIPEGPCAVVAWVVADRKEVPGQWVETGDAHVAMLMQEDKASLDDGGSALLIVAWHG